MPSLVWFERTQKGKISGVAPWPDAVEYGGKHVVSPVSVTVAMLDMMSDGFREHFDEELMDYYDATPKTIERWKSKMRPERILFPGEEDPTGLSRKYRIVARIDNPTGSDDGFFAGLDPKTGEIACRDFN